MQKLVYSIAIVSLMCFQACNNEIEHENPAQQKLTLNRLLTEQEGYIKIQLTQLKSGHISLGATLNKVKGRFILDTGASTTIIDRKHRKKFKLITEKTEKIAKTAGGVQLQMLVSKRNTIEFEKLSIKNFKVSLINLNHVNYSFKRMGIAEVDGVLGTDVLKSRKGVIDYANLILYLKK